ncbi:LysR family transcriptional regulator [Saprospira sp. CCB-QB6]|uniref:LysR family transcriptional regulator n=1 Tax=Saprospira sp. CCB-QB6 TaxID=3023936 RepID=UPI00234A46E7|nr:LysR family transcriptional regulator [Saprospira sp. CCB-QB6]WCL81498.1 LysR family transcriptional regulator [Saprospira sp. CCB-QB6]
MLNLEWLRSFKAIYEQGNISRAAPKLYSSQPGLSMQLAALEQHLGYKLFIRAGRKMKPTEEAKQLYAYALPALERLDRVEELFQQRALQKRERIRIGLCSEIFSLVLAPQLSTLSFDVHARFADNSTLFKELEQGLLDLLITAQPLDHSLKNRFEATPFSQEQLYLIGSAHLDLSPFQQAIEDQNYKLLAQQLREFPWYAVVNEMDHSRRFWSDNFNEPLPFQPNFMLPSLSTIIQCLKTQEGLAIIPDILVQKELKNKELQLVWSGKMPSINTLYFIRDKHSRKQKELESLNAIFQQKMPQQAKKELQQ